jgi:hypothetical protein
VDECADRVEHSRQVQRGREVVTMRMKALEDGRKSVHFQVYLRGTYGVI